MNEYEFAQLGFGLLIVLAICGALRAWRMAVLEFSRQRAFALRADLFDVATKKNALDDDDYKEMRLVLNGYLRTAHRVSGMWVLWIVLVVLRKQDRITIEVSGPMADEIIEAHKQLRQIGRLQTWICGLDGLIAMLILSACGLAKRCRGFDALYEKAGCDEEFARQRLWDGPLAVG